MGNVRVLPFRLGHAAKEQLEKKFRTFYQKVADWMLPANHGGSLPEDLFTIPVPQNSDSATTHLVFEGIKQASDNSADLALVIIDLANPADADMPSLPLATGLTSGINKLKEKLGDRLRLVVLASGKLDEEDCVYSLIKPLLGDHVQIIYDDGTDDGCLANARGVPGRKAYVDALAEARNDPLWLLKRKMLRRIDHFRRPVYRNGREEQHCHRYYYDGHGCEKEVADLIERHIRRHFRNTTPTLFVFCPLSTWLPTAAGILKERECIAGFYNLPAPEDGERDDGAVGSGLSLADLREELQDHPPLLILPMVDSGTTLAKLVAKFENLGLGGAPHVMAVMKTSTAAVGTLTSREPGGQESSDVTVAGKTITVWPLLNVEQIGHEPGQCPWCALKIPHAEKGRDEGWEIPSHAMWHMILEAGVVPERDVPKEWRGSLGDVPDFQKIIEHNGPWLATKVQRLLGSKCKPLPTNVVILRPLESGAKVLADCMTSQTAFGEIAVPREVITLFDKNEDAAIAKKECKKVDGGQAVLAQLRDTAATARTAKLGQQVGLVLMDEFNSSGRTRTGLLRLAQAFDLRVLCYICLVDFGKPETSPIPCLSLYRFHLEEEVPANHGG